MFPARLPYKSFIPDNFKRSGAGKEMAPSFKCNHPSSFGPVHVKGSDAPMSGIRFHKHGKS